MVVLFLYHLKTQITSKIALFLLHHFHISLHALLLFFYLSFEIIFQFIYLLIHKKILIKLSLNLFLSCQLLFHQLLILQKL